MSKKVLLVGCGQVGSRHLQAVSSLNEVSEIHIVDSNSKSIDLAKTLLGEVPDINRKIKFKLFKELSDDSREGDIFIVATLAKGRCELVKQIENKLNYKNFLIEKIASQSVREYLDLLQFCEKKELSVWVNCQMRSYKIHKYIKSLLDPSEPIIFGNFGGNLGLACTGIHYADLFLFYDGSKEIKSACSNIDNILHPSKRGKDIYDLSGMLCGYSKKGNRCIISYGKTDMGPDYVSIVSSRYKFIVDNYITTAAFESRADSNWTWRRVPIKEKYLVSLMSKRVVFDIFKKGTCNLPTLSECLPAHKYILSELLPHFNKLLSVKDDYCPVT